MQNIHIELTYMIKTYKHIKTYSCKIRQTHTKYEQQRISCECWYYILGGYIMNGHGLLGSLMSVY